MQIGTEVLIIVLVVLFALVAGGIVSASLRAERRRRERQDYLLSLGFTPLPEPPIALIASITDLRQREAEPPPDLHNVYHRPIAGGDLYLFDISAQRGSASSAAATPGSVAIIAPGLRLPRVMLAPRLTLEGAAGDLLGSFLGRALDWSNARTGLDAYTFTDPAGFDLHYTVLGLDEAAVRACLTPARLARLLTLDRKYLIEGMGDTVVLTAGLVSQAQPYSVEQEDPRDPYLLRTDAESLLALLRSPATAPE